MVLNSTEFLALVDAAKEPQITVMIGMIGMLGALAIMRRNGRKLFRLRIKINLFGRIG